MSGRPAGSSLRPTDPEAAARATALPRLRLEVLQELQQLVENREARDRIDRGPLAEAKGREHWVLHLLLRAQESSQAHLDRLVGSSYANLTARVQNIDDRLGALSETDAAHRTDLVGRLDVLSTSLAERMDRGFSEGTERIGETASARLTKELRDAWAPIEASIESFAKGSKEMVQQVSDTYKVATQTRLLLNENARRLSDLGRDLVALEDSLKLVVQRSIEESLAPLERRLAELEGRAGVRPPSEAIAVPEPATDPPAPSPTDPDG